MDPRASDPIPDFPGFVADLLTKGYSSNPCRDTCQDLKEHVHLKDPGGFDMIAWADGNWSGYDLTQPCRIIYPAPQGRQLRTGTIRWTGSQWE